MGVHLPRRFNLKLRQHSRGASRHHGQLKNNPLAFVRGRLHLMSKLYVGLFVIASVLALSGAGFLGLVLVTNLIYLVIPSSGTGR
jgi:hypothetical protein